MDNIILLYNNYDTDLFYILKSEYCLLLSSWNCYHFIKSIDYLLFLENIGLNNLINFLGFIFSKYLNKSYSNIIFVNNWIIMQYSSSLI